MFALYKVMLCYVKFHTIRCMFGVTFKKNCQLRLFLIAKMRTITHKLEFKTDVTPELMLHRTTELKKS